MTWDFLREAARQRPETLHKVRVILGNESCDLDSAVSCIVYAFFQTRVAQANPLMGKVIPVFNISKEDFEMKTEVIYFLRKCGVPLEDLFFRNTIDLDVLRSSGALELILVDHHNLSGEDIWLKPYVVEVIDHRPIDPDWTWKDIKSTIETVGSCATLIAEIAIKQKVFPVPQEVMLLLYGAIILDTACFSENPKKYTSRDVAVVEQLEKQLTQRPSRDKIYKELLSARCDISNLTLSQILRKDMKVVCGIPICSVPLLVQDFLSEDGAEDELSEFADTYQRNAVILLGVSSLGKEFKREIAVFAEDERLLMAVTDALRNSTSPDLELQSVETFSENGKLHLFLQLNTQASRKQIVPIVKQAVLAFEGEVSEPGSPTD